MAKSNPNPYELRILGAPDLRAPDGRRVTSVLSQPSRLGLLAYLALAPDPVTRATVVADFWPERDEARARNALSQALFYLRRSMGKDAVRNVEGDRLWVPPERVWCDARELLGADRPSTAVVEAASDELLAGWNAETSQPLQEWLDTTRRRVRQRAAALGTAREPEPDSEAGGEGERADADRIVPASGEAPSSRRGWLRTVAAVAVVVAAALVAIVTLTGRPQPSAATASPTPARLAVLLPRVTPASPGAPELDPLALNAELLASLSGGDAVDLVSVPWATSLQDFMGQQELMGPPGELDPTGADMPEWVLDVSVRVDHGTAHVVWVLYRGVESSVSEADRFDERFSSAEELVVEVPRGIAEGVAARVGELVRP